MTDIDARLRIALSRAATPADPSGVADAIRARIAAGEAGTPASSSGFSSTFLGMPIGRWLAWLAIAVVAMLVAVAGVSGAFGTTGWSLFGWPVSSTTGGVVGEPGFAPSGDPSENPIPSATPSLTPSATPTATPGPSPSSEEPADPSPTPSTSKKPQPPPAPTDTTQPQIQQSWVSPTEVYNGEPVVVGVVASDNVAVTRVTVSWTGPTTSGSGSMINRGSGQWELAFNPSTDDYGIYTVTMRAQDARGNTSAASTVQFLHVFFG